jgi:DNA polymerase III epsilon subunit-like protein
MTLVFDTETTGKADFKAKPTDPCQPRIAQLGAILYSPDWKPLVEANLIVQPFDFDIPVEASRIHGITTEHAKKFGIEEPIALDVFDALLKAAKTIVAHNIAYDILVLQRAYHVHDRHLRICTQYCTMHAMTDICKLPGKYDSYKWPTLQEAYKHCFNRPFTGAHDAMADVRACAEVYQWLQDRKEFEPC